MTATIKGGTDFKQWHTNLSQRIDMATAPRPTTGTRGSRWVARIAITLGCTIGFIAVLAMSIGQFGRVQGVEFSPDTFGSREFTYYELPLIRFRISSVYRDRATGSLQSQLAGGGRLKSATTDPPQDPPRWDMVWMQRGGTYYDDDAKFVYRYFDQDNSDASSYWQQWTTDHPKLADVLWPAVAEACRKELYLFTPQLFAVAEQLTVPEGTSPSVEQFKAAIAQAMAEQYTAIGDVRRREGKHLEAIELYTAALKHDADFRTALDGREKSYYETGESEKSKQDRDRVRAVESGTDL